MISLQLADIWHAPLPLRMWNWFGRIVTLEVCAGVAPTLIVATVPCPRINQVPSLPIGPSIHVGRAKTSLNGISPSRGMALLTHHGNAPRGGCLYSYFSYSVPYFVSYCITRILFLGYSVFRFALLQLTSSVSLWDRLRTIYLNFSYPDSVSSIDMMYSAI